MLDIKIFLSVKKDLVSLTQRSMLPIELESEIRSQVVARCMLVPGVNRVAVFPSHLPAWFYLVWHDAAAIHFSTTAGLKTGDRLVKKKQISTARFDSKKIL